MAQGILPSEQSLNKRNDMQIIFNCSRQHNASVFIYLNNIYIFTQIYILCLRWEALIYSKCNIPCSEILINVCARYEWVCACLCKNVHTQRFLPSAISHDADLQQQIGQGKEGESIVHFIHIHACTHINQKASEPICAQIAPWCIPSFTLCTRIIKHRNSQTCCPLHFIYTRIEHTKRRQKWKMLYVMQWCDRQPHGCLCQKDMAHWR